MADRKKIVVRFLKAAMSIAFFVLLSRFIKRDDFIKSLSHIDPFYLFLSIVMLPLMIATSCLKWTVLLGIQGTPVGFWYLLRTYFVGYYFSNIMPSNVGGDVIRSYYAGRRINSQSQAAASVFMERFTGVLLLLLMVIVLPFFEKGLYPQPMIVLPALMAAGLLVLLCWLFWRSRPLTALCGLIRAIVAALGRGAVRMGLGVLEGMFARLGGVADSVERKVDRFHDRLHEASVCLLKNRMGMVNVVVLTGLFYVMTWFNVYFSFRAFGLAPAFWDVSLILPTAMLMAMIPITLGSIGIAETSYVYYFGLMGIAAAPTLAMGLLLRFKMILSGLVGLCFYLFNRSERIENVEQLRNSES